MELYGWSLNRTFEARRATVTPAVTRDIGFAITCYGSTRQTNCYGGRILTWVPTEL